MPLQDEQEEDMDMDVDMDMEPLSGPDPRRHPRRQRPGPESMCRALS